MQIGHGSALGEVRCRVSVAVQHPLGGQQTLHAYGTAGVDASRADAHLGSCSRKTKQPVLLWEREYKSDTLINFAVPTVSQLLLTVEFKIISKEIQLASKLNLLKCSRYIKDDYTLFIKIIRST